MRSIPTLLVFHKGKVIGQLVGAAPKPKIEQFVKDALAKTAAHWFCCIVPTACGNLNRAEQRRICLCANIHLWRTR